MSEPTNEDLLECWNAVMKLPDNWWREFLQIDNKATLAVEFALLDARKRGAEAEHPINCYRGRGCVSCGECDCDWELAHAPGCSVGILERLRKGRR